ncbi:MAG: hypothetical protein U0T83_04040 [Bacteriovoracaceae bacterium]
MANRNKSYDEVLAKKFDNLEYAQGYLLNIMKSEKASINKALIETIKAMGLQNFANKSGLSIQSVSDFVQKRQKWSTDKLAKHIKKVFRLNVIISLESAYARKAA